MRLMGIDYGEKRIGVALSDESGKFAFPHAVIKNSKNILLEIKDICGKYAVKKIILGQSVDYQGRPNPIMKEIEEFKKTAEEGLGLPVEYEREVLTTQEAMLLPGKTGRQKTEKTDASAAALILRSFIEKENML